MRLHYIQHVPFEGIGCIEEWALAQGYEVTSSKMYEDDTLPEIAHLHWLVVLGGPMGVYDYAEYPWLKKEICLIQRAIEEDRIVLGICLGAQLMAKALGTRVYSNWEKEIGWLPIELTDEGKQSPLFDFMPPKLDVLHWHGDTFMLPYETVCLAKSEICMNQAYAYSERVIALQFHMEMTQQGLRSIVEHCADELQEEGPYMQTAEQILARENDVQTLQPLMIELLNRLHAETLRRPPSNTIWFVDGKPTRIPPSQRKSSPD